jgi:hypothetical protein
LCRKGADDGAARQKTAARSQRGRAAAFCSEPASWPAERCARSFAFPDALGENFGGGGHRAAAFEVGLVSRAEAFDNGVARFDVVRVVEHEGIAEDAVFAVDVDGGFAGLGLAGRAGALVSETGIARGFHG